MFSAQVLLRIIIGLMVAIIALIGIGESPAAGQDAQPGPPNAAGAIQPAQAQPASQPADPNLVPLDIKLPRPAFRGTPKHVPAGANLEKPRTGPRPPFLAPQGAKLVSQGKPVTSSDMEPIIGSLKLVTDGDKEADEGKYVELGPRTQWVQIDLKTPHAIHAIVVWHYHTNPRVYHDVVVQVADDPDFISNAKTVYNNDHDNSAGLGVGHELEFWETYEGRLIDAGGVPGRYVRLYSNGSTTDDQNHYVEVEVYGTPAK